MSEGRPAESPKQQQRLDDSASRSHIAYSSLSSEAMQWQTKSANHLFLVSVKISLFYSMGSLPVGRWCLRHYLSSCKVHPHSVGLQVSFLYHVLTYRVHGTDHTVNLMFLFNVYYPFHFLSLLYVLRFIFLYFNLTVYICDF